MRDLKFHFSLPVSLIDRIHVPGHRRDVDNAVHNRRRRNNRPRSFECPLHTANLFRAGRSINAGAKQLFAWKVF